MRSPYCLLSVGQVKAFLGIPSSNLEKRACFAAKLREGELIYIIESEQNRFVDAALADTEILVRARF